MRHRKIALVASALGTGGVERQLLTLAQHMDRERFQVELIALQGGGSLDGEARALGIAIWCAGVTRGFDLAAILRLRHHLVDEGVEVVLAANQYATLILRLAITGMARRPRLLSAFHSSPAHIGSGWRDRLRLVLYRWSLRYVDGLVFVSEQQRREWRERGLAPGLPNEVIYNGVDVDHFASGRSRDVRAELGWGPKCFVVGLCAALRPEKRVGDLLEAALIMVRLGVPLRVLIVGDGPERGMVERRIDSLGLRNTVVLVGRQADVRPYIHACDAMTLVSSAEAFSIAVLEAMACGKPLVLTQVGGAAEQIEHGTSGFLLPPGQPERVARCLHDLWSSGRARSMGESARRHVSERFSLNTMVQRYEDLLCAEPGRGPGPQAPTPTWPANSQHTA